MRCVSTSEKPDTSDHGEQEVCGRSCSQTGIDEANQATTATSEVVSKDKQVKTTEEETDEEVEKKGEEKITNEKEKERTKLESELEDWSKSLDEVLQAAGD